MRRYPRASDEHLFSRGLAWGTVLSLALWFGIVALVRAVWL